MSAAPWGILQSIVVIICLLPCGCMLCGHSLRIMCPAGHLASCFCRRLIRASLSLALARSAGLLLVRFDTRYGWSPVSLRGARISGLPACRECLSFSAVYIHNVMHRACFGGVWGLWCGLCRGAGCVVLLLISVWVSRCSIVCEIR